jgi:hypothetical protein
MLVRAAHLVASRAQQPGQGAHAGSGDANQVQLHRMSADDGRKSGRMGQKDKIGSVSPPPTVICQLSTLLLGTTLTAVQRFGSSPTLNDQARHQESRDRDDPSP